MLIEIQKFEKPFDYLSFALVATNIKLLENSINKSFVILNDSAKSFYEFFSKKAPWIVRTEKALSDFGEKIDNITKIEGLYVRLREAFGRTPSGYIADLQVTIPDSNRKLELQIYDIFSELLQSYQPLLFDLHISKLKGRNPEEIIPEGFWRYER